MKIAIASDHAAVDLRLQVTERLEALGHEVEDFGPEPGERVDYPKYAAAVAGAVVAGDAEAGVLLCGSGIGMSIAANKVIGIRAALVHDATTARLAREHNDANVLCLGARTTGPLVALECVEAWLSAGFEVRHQPRLDQIARMEA